MKTILFLLITFIFSLSSSAFNLDSLLVKSLGGEKALNSLKNLESFYSTGVVDLNGLKGTFRQYYLPPDKFYLANDFKSFSLVQAYDGSTAWQKGINGQVTVLEGMEKKDMLKNLYMESVSYLIDGRFPGGKEYLGIKEFDGVECHEVAFYPLNSDTVLTYYEVESGTRKFSVNRLDMLTSRTVMDDYRLVDDILFPFNSRAEIKEMSFYTVFKVDSVLLNQPFDTAIFSKPSGSLSDFHFPEKTDQVSIPFVYHNGHIRIPATINGKKKITFILDSGASANIFNSQPVDELNLEVVGSVPSVGIAGFEDISLVKTDSLQIGELTLYDMVGGKMNLESVGASFKSEEEFGGLLGYDFLSRFPILIDYQNLRITVFNPDSFTPPDSGFEIPFTLTIQIPTIEADIKGVKGQYIVDLGNAFGLVLHRDFVDFHQNEGIVSHIKENPKLVGGVGGIIRGRNALVSSFQMGDIRLDSLRALVPDSSLGITGSKALAGNIGNKILENFKVLFDYKNSRLIFYKISG